MARKGVAYQFVVTLESFSVSGTYQVNPTLAAGDVKISKDGGAPANVTNLPAAISSSALVLVSLTASEMNANQVVILFHDAAGGEWKDYIEYIEPIDDVVDAVWDEALTGATHNVPTSAGRRLRQMDTSIYAGLVVSATENTITLDSGASSSDGAYDPAMIFIDEGPGAGQCRLILQYAGSSRVATVDRDWRVLPTSSSTFVITGDTGREHVNEGLARGGTETTITLNANASNYDNAYVGQRVFIRSGTGEDQARRVSAYNGTTKIATVTHAWDVIPDTTSGYVMLPTGAITDDCIGNAVWTYDVRTLTQSMSDGISLSVDVDITRRRGDSWTIAITGLGPLTGYTSLWFTIKMTSVHTDAQAIIQIRKNASGLSDGLLIVNGAACTMPANGSITINDEAAGNITIDLQEAVTDDLEPGLYVFDFQTLIASVINTPYSGRFEIVSDVSRSVV